MAITEISEDGFTILTSAVNLAKQYQCSSVGQLKSLLTQHYPDSQESIDEALQFWGSSRRCDGWRC